jgi:hypothetical protein
MCGNKNVQYFTGSQKKPPGPISTIHGNVNKRTSYGVSAGKQRPFHGMLDVYHVVLLGSTATKPSTQHECVSQ